MAAEVMPITGRSSVSQGQPYRRAERTKAVPKHTLFGAEIQQFDLEEKEKIKKIDLQEHQREEMKERLARQQRYKPNLPQYLRKKIPEGDIKMTQNELEKQMQQTSRAKNMLDLIEEKSKYFQVGARAQTWDPPSESKDDKWMSEKDIKNAEKMNKVGIRQDKQGYNRDKYQQPNISHDYALIGNPLKTGMDFTETDSYSPPKEANPHYKRHKAPDWLPPAAFIPKSKSVMNDDSLAIHLPPNIMHKFGTRICRDVLKDKDKIGKCLDTHAKIRSSFHNPRTERKPTSVQEEVSNPDYESLSQAVRQNIFPGYSEKNINSQMKSTYTPTVFDRRVPDPDQWRCQRDELTIWNEHNFMVEHMKRKWEEYQDSLPKLSANWDRNAKRPPPVLQDMKPKPKPKPRREKVKKSEEPFPEVEFKTPPLTPLPPKEDKIPVQTNERDNEFWSFYDQ